LNVSVLSTTPAPAPAVPVAEEHLEHLEHLTNGWCPFAAAFVAALGGGSCRELNLQRDFLFGSHLVGVQ